MRKGAMHNDPMQRKKRYDEETDVRAGHNEGRMDTDERERERE